MPYESRNGQHSKNSVNQQSSGGINANTDLSHQKDRDANAKKQAANKKAYKTAAKAAASYYGGEAGAKAVDALSNTKAGQKIMDMGGKYIDSNPAYRNAAKLLNKTGALDAADKALGGSGSKGKVSLNNKNLDNNKLNSNLNNNLGGGRKDDSSPLSSALKRKNELIPQQNNQQLQDVQGEYNKNNKEENEGPNIAGLGPFGRKRKSILDEDSEEEIDSKDGSGTFKAIISNPIVLLAIGSIIFIILVAVIIMSAVSTVTNSINDFEDAFGASMAAGEDTGDITYDVTGTDAEEFYERLNDAKSNSLAYGQSVDVLKVSALYHVLSENGADISYNDMDEYMIGEFADATAGEGDQLKEDLVNGIFTDYFPKYDDEAKEQLADDVLDYIERYNEFIGKETDSSSSCASLGSCVYDIKGFYIPGKGNLVKNLNVVDLQVRIMQTGSGNGHNYGGTWGQALEKDLVPFEKYILGVAYQEIGPDAPDEAFKAQMVAARSYILARPFDMGGWRKLEQESDGKWVIQVAGSTQDQVYCDPDKGCSASDGQWSQVYSGLDHGTVIKQPMAENDKHRSLAAETMGEVVVNNQGNIVYTDYAQSEQNQMASLARSGLNYKQILLQMYGSRGASDIYKADCNDGTSGSACTSGSTGPYANWKQSDSEWANVKMGDSGKTIKQIGCLVTSVAMLIEKSGVDVTIDNFNPGTFVEFLNNHGGFASGGNFVWDVTSQVAPKLKYQGQISVAGMTKNQKLKKLQELLDKKAYVVAEVKGNTGQHWVAIDKIENNQIVMMDPGSESTDMWGQYPWKNTSTYAYFLEQ